MPAPPSGPPVDVVYLCSPNNPTGAVATRAQLAAWVAYAREHGTLLLFDAAYEAYITDPDLPRSIYEIPGARECAIEFRSFSKNGGFTGTRCAYTVVPKSLLAANAAGERQPLHPLWLRRTTTKFNGVPYLVQRAAEALYTEAGRGQVAALVRHYLGNAELLGGGGAPGRADRPRRTQRALPVGADAVWDDQLGDLRPHAAGGPCGDHPGERLRGRGRGLFPDQRVQQPGQRRGGGASARGPELVNGQGATSSGRTSRHSSWSSQMMAG